MTFRRTRCAQCKAKFVPERPSQIVHKECIEAWTEAQAAKREREEAKAARMAAKLERATDRQRKAALKTIPQLIAKAQISFNAFIRARDRHKGCFVCGCAFSDEPGKVMHAGHVRSRGAAGHLRFHEENCMGECEGCNGPHGAKPHQIKAGAIARIGQAAFDALEADNTPHKWTHEELRAIDAKYRSLTKELLKEKT
ncbi:MAG: NinG protein [Variovorax paradoxus]|uniref:NinG protein n=1 Tax=Variovorax paradoxus TaxID=34073 RepID=A0A2W5QSR8_VARPD|nr:MAG: NinG protein [Variovorax paradoxus]